MGAREVTQVGGKGGDARGRGRSTLGGEGGDAKVGDEGGDAGWGQGRGRKLGAREGTQVGGKGGDAAELCQSATAQQLTTHKRNPCTLLALRVSGSRPKWPGSIRSGVYLTLPVPNVLLPPTLLASCDHAQQQ
jgi:hypothetical protein